MPAQNYTKEAALCFNSQTTKAPVSKEISTNDTKIRRARIISVFGDSEGIDTNADKDLLQKLKKKGAELIPLVEPSRAEFNMLWEEACDILFFAGHSETQNNGQAGVININPHDALSLTDIKKTLRTAIAKGLKLAIFNSCNGLGLATELARLNLGYIIVWREVVPDIIAQKFIEYFLSAFARGKSFLGFENLNPLDKAEAIAREIVKTTDFEEEEIATTLATVTKRIERDGKTKELAKLIDVSSEEQQQGLTDLNVVGAEQDMFLMLLKLGLNPVSVRTNLIPMLSLPQDLKDAISLHD